MGNDGKINERIKKKFIFFNFYVFFCGIFLDISFYIGTKEKKLHYKKNTTKCFSSYISTELNL